MPIELARVKLRGLYAIVAGLFLLVGIPLFEGAVLVPAGYFTAIEQVAGSGGFAPLLAWASQHAGLDLTFHIVELVPFLLVVGLPGSLRRALWPRDSWIGRVAALCGMAGFGLYGLAVVIGAFATRSAADTFASGTQFQAQTAAGYASQYAFQTLISHVLGGLLVGLCLLLVGARIVRTRLLPRWLGFASIVPAGFLAITAVQFLAAPTQVETATSSLTFALLALWLIAMGVCVARLRRLADAETAPSDDVPASSETGASDGASDTASQANQRSDAVTDRHQ
jgi:Domain of unknown function (DUF4386)